MFFFIFSYYAATPKKNVPPDALVLTQKGEDFRLTPQMLKLLADLLLYDLNICRYVSRSYLNKVKPF